MESLSPVVTPNPVNFSQAGKSSPREKADLLAGCQLYLCNTGKLIGNLNSRVRSSHNDNTLAGKGLRCSIS